MTIFNFLELVGGLCLFLFGMSTLGDSLTTISGGKMEQLLGRLSSNKFKGMLLGMVVTAVIQSSSATTVMVVALVNSGVMKLFQAVPIIMGANIGTTVTGWVLSLSGISGESLLVQLLKPSSFTPVLAFAGIIITFTAKQENKKATGTALLGFSVLMYGMGVMSTSVAPLHSDPRFYEVIHLFTNPLLGVLAGAIITAVMQSSSAMTGILQALSTTGAITFGSVVPLIMGQNIGTCITAILSSIGAGKNAKRASFVHLSFNVIGTVLFMLLFYITHYFFPFTFMEDRVNEVNIAIVHTIFNMFTVVVLFPFSDQLVKLSKVVIPPREQKIKRDDLAQTLRLLDPRFLDRPGLAVEQAYQVMGKMMECSVASLRTSMELLFEYEPEEYAHVEMLENQVDQYEDALTEYTMKITASPLNLQDNSKLTIMMHSLNDIERISDHAINIADQAKKKTKTNVAFSEEAIAELRTYTDIIAKIVEVTGQALTDLDLDTALEVQPIEARIDEINKTLTDLHIERLKKGICRVENGIIIVEIYNCLERIADHCYNMSVCIIQFSEHHYRQHDFESRFSHDSPKYKELYNYYKSQYALPEKIAASKEESK